VGITLRGQISHQPYERCILANLHLARLSSIVTNRSSLLAIVFLSLLVRGWTEIYYLLIVA